MGGTKINPDARCRECLCKLFMREDRRSGYCREHYPFSIENMRKKKASSGYIADDAWTENWFKKFEERSERYRLAEKGMLTHACKNCGVKLHKWDAGYLYCWECLQIPYKERDGYYLLNI